ncbi:hypothetical protein ACBQ88_17190 [Citrobacter braakii]|uniref:hypothetical protein n=1 Tax=Citrobacter braakii TaxID=57706 RepID=UPI003524AD06
MQVKIITDTHKQNGKPVNRNAVIVVHDAVGAYLIAHKIAQKDSTKTAVKSTDKTETE